MSTSSAIPYIPRLGALVRHALPTVVESTLIPVALFYGFLWLVGTRGAVVAGLLWSYAALLWRALRRRRIPGLLLLGSLALTARTVSALATGSLFVYFLQPTLGTFAAAAAFLLSVPAGRPLAERLAADFVPLPPGFVAQPFVRRLFVRITLLWAFVLLANAAIATWLLVSQPLRGFLVTKTSVSGVLMAAAVAVSTLWFRRSVRRHAPATTSGGTGAGGGDGGRAR